MRSLLMLIVMAFAALMALVSAQQGDWWMALLAFVVFLLAGLGK